MIRLRGQLRCLTPEDAAAVAAFAPDHIRLSRAEPGCLSFDLDPTDSPMIWELMETFRDRAAFDAHQARTRASPWFDATRSAIRDFRIEEVGD